jgi:choline dehydrogenase-like flavoprotein
VVDKSGRATALVYQANDEAKEREHSAKVLIVAAGALESARLLLLSASERHPDGLGNDGGHVGKHLTFQHLWQGQLHYKEHLHPVDLVAIQGKPSISRSQPGNRV